MKVELRAWVYTRKHLCDALDDERIRYVYAPMRLIDGGVSAQCGRIVLLPPEFLADCEAQVSDRLGELKDEGFDKALAHTVGHIELLQRLGYELFGGGRLNCTNSETLKFLNEQGIADVILSPELTAAQINAIRGNASGVRTGYMAYGKLPLMLNRRCPIRNGKPCGNENRSCDKQITDRTGRKLDVLCSENAVEILNSDVLSLSDRLDSFNADFAVLRFTTESDVKPVIDAYYEGKALPLKNITRGLYFRGLAD